MNPMRITKLGTIGALAALVAMSGAATAEAQQIRTRVVTTAPQPAQAGGGVTEEKQVTLVRTDDDGREVLIKLRNGEVVTATLDGKDVPSERVMIQGNVVKMLGDSDAVLFEWAQTEPPRPPSAPGAPMMFRFEEGNEHQFRVFSDAEGEGTRWVLDHPTVFGQPGETPKVMLGVSLADPDRSLREHFDLQPGQATMLLSVYDGLPAAEAGLQAYDLVLDVGGKSAGPSDLRAALKSAEPGDTLELTVIQAGKRKNITVRLQAHDAEKLQAAARRYREAMAAQGEDMGFFDFNVIAPPAPPSPPEPPQLRGLRQLDEEQLKLHLRRLETDTRARTEDARRRAEQMAREAETRQRRVEVERRRQTGGDQQQLERLEERMERLERLLERIAEDRETQRRGGSGGGN